MEQMRFEEDPAYQVRIDQHFFFGISICIGGIAHNKRATTIFLVRQYITKYIIWGRN